MQFAKYNVERQPTITISMDIHEDDSNLSGHEDLGDLPISKITTVDERTSLDFSNLCLYVIIILKN